MWAPVLGEKLICSKDERDEAKEYETFAISVYDGEQMLVGHVPIELSRVAKKLTV